MHEGVGGCEGLGVIWAADLIRGTSLLYPVANSAQP